MERHRLADDVRLRVALRVGHVVQDLLGGVQYNWHGTHNYVLLDPARAPAHIFRISNTLREDQAIDRLG